MDIILLSALLNIYFNSIIRFVFIYGNELMLIRYMKEVDGGQFDFVYII